MLIQVVNTLHDMFFSSMDSEEVCSSFTFTTAVMTFSLITVLICILMIGIHMTNRRMKKHRIQLSTHLLHANKALHEMLFCGEGGDDRRGMMAGNGRSRHGSMSNNKMDANTNMGINYQRRRKHIPQSRASTSTTTSPASTAAGAATSGHQEQEALSYDFSAEKEKSVSQLQECIESANAVVQTVVEFDDVLPLKIMNMHVEKEYIFTVISSVFLYGLLLYNYCNEGFNFLS